MDIGTALSVAQTLFSALQCSELKEICFIAGYKSKLDELRGTVIRIKAVLKDAEAKQELSEQERLHIEELKDAVYEADDLFDEFVTLAEQKQLTKGIKVRVLSLFSKFGMAYNMAQGVKKIKKKLDAIAYNCQFNLNIDPKPISNRRLETCSYVYEADIIGRELDLEKIVGILLDSNLQQNVSFLPIVGIGGLGKTALAQLVYNDARVTTVFPMRLWTCVSDENQGLLDVEGVLGKILASAKGHKNYEGCTMDGLQSKLREQLEGKRYLIVLDDVWTENYDRWHLLTQFLMGGQRGSWIMVTTRSWETARIIGDGPRHKLQGLSNENSWCLFERVAFGSQHSTPPPEDLVMIGKDIVERCANVPLAIKVVGSLLYGQNKNKWLSVQKLGLQKVKGSQDNIMPILKLSYNQLESPLKSCFSYCAIFPKDFVIRKSTLISLWMAQGYILLDDHRQSMEDVAEEYISILLWRCFFQDVQEDEYGDIRSFKIHDLMHDVAQEVVGKEICTANTISGDVDKNFRHLSVIKEKDESVHFSSTKIHVRSYLHVGGWYQGDKVDQVCVGALIANWKYLRALNLSGSDIKILPGSIGELLHLRYLDLSCNDNLAVLPRQITKLYNLQTFNLCMCSGLKELPTDLRKLVKLRVFDLLGCNRLSYMPRGMGNLTCLHKLTMFVLGEKSSSRKELEDGLEDLKALRNLKDKLTIRVNFMKRGANAYMKNGGRGGGCLGNKELLKHVVFDFNEEFYFGDEEDEGRAEYDEAVMTELQPHSNLKRLEVYDFHGEKMPYWAREDNLTTFLPNLVKMKLIFCQKLQCLGQLRFPQLKLLHVGHCPNLTAILHCPVLEHLTLLDFNKRLEILLDVEPKLRRVQIDNVAWLNLLPKDPFQGGAELVIDGDKEVGSLGEAREVFCSCSSSLRSLKIYGSNLKSVVSGGLEHLTALEELHIIDCPNLSLSEESESERGVDIGMPWQPLHHPLRSLILESLYQLVDLPNWIQYLTSLQTLEIHDCKGLETLPNWMSKLTSLKELLLVPCSARLNESCQQSTGVNWPHIKHIPSIIILPD